MPEDGEVGFQGTRKEKITSVSVVLQKLASGNTIHTRGEEWKLTRAVVHAEDAWKGRVSPCPALDQERVRKLFKLRWRYRTLDFLLVHMFLVLSLLESPPWCTLNKKCFWSCYPDFSRNYHMQTWLSLTLEGFMLTVLVSIALLDMVRVSCVRDPFRWALGVIRWQGLTRPPSVSLRYIDVPSPKQRTANGRHAPVIAAILLAGSRSLTHSLLLCFVTCWSCNRRPLPFRVTKQWSTSTLVPKYRCYFFVYHNYCCTALVVGARSAGQSCGSLGYPDAICTYYYHRYHTIHTPLYYCTVRRSVLLILQ